VLGEVRTDSGTFASLLVDVPLRHDRTVFDRWGTWFPWLAGVMLLGVVVRLLVGFRGVSAPLSHL
jgi:apolipoprotein N-acyltransferase